MFKIIKILFETSFRWFEIKIAYRIILLQLTIVSFSIKNSLFF